MRISPHGPSRGSAVWLIGLYWGVLLGPLPIVVTAQDADTRPASAPAQAPRAPAEVSAETITARMAEVEDGALPSEVKSELLSLYRQALDQLTAANEWSNRAAEYRRGQAEAPAQLEAARQHVTQMATQPAPTAVVDLPVDAPLDQLAALLTSAQAQVEARRQAADALEDESKTRTTRRAAIPALLATANRRLEEFAKTLSTPPAPDAAPQATAARRALLGAQMKAAEQEVRAYEEELRFYAAQNAVLSARRDETARELADAQARVSVLQAAVSARRQADAEQEKKRVEAELARAPQIVRDLAEENAALAQERTSLAEQIDTTATRSEQAKREADHWRRELDNLREAVQRAGQLQVVGARILRVRADSARVARFTREQRSFEQEAARAEVRRSEIEDMRAALRDPEARIQSIVSSLRSTEGGTAPWLESRVRELFGMRVTLLENLQRDYETYANELVQLQVEAARLLDTARDLDLFVHEHGLWLPNAVPLTAVRWPQASAQVTAPVRALGQLLRADLRVNALSWAAAALAILALLILQPRAAHALRSGAELVHNPATDAFNLTVGALGYSLLLALPGPLFLWLLSWRVVSAADAGDTDTRTLAQATRYGLDSAALLWLTQGLLLQICRPHGLGKAHFRWNSRGVALVRRQLLWTMVITVPATIIATTSARYIGPWHDSLGRLVFIAGMLAMSIFLWRILRPRGGVLTGWLFARRNRWIFRMRYVFHAIVVAIPLALGVLSAYGYHYTAQVLAERLMVRTFWLILGVMLAYALLVRWLMVARSKPAAQAAPALAARDPAQTQAAAVDLRRLSDQTVRLLRNFVVFVLVVGLWLIWVDMAPALRVIGDVPLWSYGHDVAAAGSTGTAVAPPVRYVTLSDLTLAILIAIATTALAKDLPGFLEMTLLRRLPLDPGGRFATTTVIRYVVVIVGVVSAFGAIGVGWSRVQWLAAAITVGLGFGLQEIFANFVSGLMLLFERPIRIGDTVTVGDISGTVTRIQIRATTVTAADCKELIIPNKQFITGQIINWTLSSSMLRVVVPVTIAQSSDADLAPQLLLKVARNTRHVLADPPPAAYFIRLGERALAFELRVYVADVNRAQDVQHDLNRAILQEFQQAGIELACPQRDVRISTADGAPLIEADPPAPGRTSPSA